MNLSLLQLLIPGVLPQKHKYQQTHFLYVFKHYVKPEQYLQAMHANEYSSF